MFPTRLSILTYNLWNTQRWPEREAAVKAFFRRFRPDIFCLQELRKETRGALDKALPDYRRVDDKHPGWTGESNIFWNNLMLEELEHGIEDIAIHTDRNRGMFWVRLQVRATGQRVFVSTAHYTYQQHPDEVRSGQSPRVEQARQTVQALKKLVRDGEAGFFLGDLNDPVLPIMVLAEGGYHSCFSQLDLLPPPTWPSLPTARTGPWETITNQTIDWIVSNDQAHPISVDVPHFYLEDISPSDHWPVLAVYQLDA